MSDRRDDERSPRRDAGEPGRKGSGPSSAALLVSVPLPALLVDTEGRLLDVNEPLAALIGRPSSLMRGRSLADLAGPYAADLEGLRLLEGLRRGASVIDASLILAGGMPVPARLHVGAPLGARGERLVVLEDRREVESARLSAATQSSRGEAERALLRRICRLSDDGFVVLDELERVVEVNGEAASLLGEVPSALTGLPFTELDLPRPLRAAWLSALATSADRGRRTLRLEGGALRVDFSFERVRSPGGEPAGSVLRFALLADERDERRARRRASELAHDLRTPLATLCGWLLTPPGSGLEGGDARALAGELGAPVSAPDSSLDEQARDDLARATRALSDAVEKALALIGSDAAPQALRAEALDLVELVRDARGRLEESAGGAIELTLPEVSLGVLVDRALLEQALRGFLAPLEGQEGPCQRDGRPGSRLALESRADEVAIELCDPRRRLAAREIARLLVPGGCLPERDPPLAELRLVALGHGGRLELEPGPAGALVVRLVLPRLPLGAGSD